ncbi:AraC family transcriptional regulator [Neobacillus drentensis]|uniref:AraC family transcriptional regulator n=1 Tax=Neobacillus drentensis TaxID=220684 RepID=UPI001F429876|nr:AraC family transcriptional regulator [Neobacillus drentensis]ULT56817.1 AraC family transcriptional regulator [Neobacillus drentensis]
MIQEKTLHILNGQAMYNFYIETDFLKGELMVPFNEAMCYGSTCNDLFSPEFIDIRAKVHHVRRQQYTEHAIKPLLPLINKEFTNIVLWFDADMFCQINLLTILAWLDMADYKEDIDIHIVGDQFEPVSHFRVAAKGYQAMYDQVLIHKRLPDQIELSPLKKGIELYLNYLNHDSDLMVYIQAHQDMSENELVLALIDQFTGDYGLGDTQYLEIIKAQRQTK